jgi:hypothetical protein
MYWLEQHYVNLIIEISIYIQIPSQRVNMLVMLRTILILNNKINLMNQSCVKSNNLPRIKIK